ncbi:MAG: hypothetical protein HY866_20610 [Chloroflexi bacterium]|nr:hypothetical protein [Chloroflexota bacterium]
MVSQGRGSGITNGILVLIFVFGGVSALLSFVGDITGGPSDETRRIVEATSTNVVIGLLFLVGLIGLVLLPLRSAELRRQVGVGIMLSWGLLLAGGAFYNLLPALLDISQYTRSWLTNLLYGVGSLWFVALFSLKWVRLRMAQSESS